MTLLFLLGNMAGDPMEEPQERDSFEHIIYGMTRLNPANRISIAEAKSRLTALANRDEQLSIVG